MTMSWMKYFNLSSAVSARLTILLQQKWSSCTWLLLQEFVKLRQEQEKALEVARAAGKIINDANLTLPSIPYVGTSFC
jgi:hypothetical protein